MGQPITVVAKPAVTPGVLRLETNRSLTGMGHERYRRGDEITGHRPPDELARRLFERGGIDAVHVYSNVITVDLAKGSDGAGVQEVVENLFIHYRPGVLPPTDEELTGTSG
ncbi:MAG TPA: hypothetical protein VNT56_10565 [Acidimicrobiales bacterium]|jgi:hypothetical protein|nr:hypothetical protein [Acidimicrobiales bacterium]